MGTMDPIEPDVDRSPILTGIFAAECAVSLAFLLMRLWARTKTSAGGWDDVFMVITWFLFTTVAIIVAIFGASGGTRHSYYLSDEQVIYVTKLNWIAQPFGIIALATGKIAVGLLLLRVIASTSRWRRVTICFLMASTFISNVLAVVLTFAQCKDPAALWDPSVHAITSCWDPRVQSGFSTFTGSLNSAVDILFSLIPTTVIWKLQISAKRRLGLVILLSGGVLSGISAAIKTNQLVSLTARSDLNWETFGLYLWTGIEIFLILVCGCIPTLRPLWDQFSGRRLRSHQVNYSRWASHIREEEHDAGSANLSQDRSYELSRIHRGAPVTSIKRCSSQFLPVSRDETIGPRPASIRDDEQLIHVTRSYHVDYS
ncbi:hypothetical protein F5Y03DRAFT_253870 [Xylaria venustula]|nr:hypothetical protein F5Y03DRAFT_253870 [Xylaria venustula]